MGQQANSGRNATLDEKKRRAAGRQGNNSPEADAIKDSVGLSRQKGRAGGAFGKSGGQRKATDAGVPRRARRARGR